MADVKARAGKGQDQLAVIYCTRTVRKYAKNNWDISKGFRSPLDEAPIGQVWERLF